MGKSLALVITIVLAAIIGNVMNAIHCIDYIGSDTVDSTAEVVIRIVGIFVPFIGGIAGYF